MRERDVRETEIKREQMKRKRGKERGWELTVGARDPVRHSGHGAWGSRNR